MFTSGQVYVNGVDRTTNVSDPQALTWSKTRGGVRGECRVPLQLMSDDSYAPNVGDVIEIWDPPVGLVGQERAWVGTVEDYDIDFQDNDGLRLIDLNGVTLHQMFDTVGCPQVDFTAENAASIFGFLFASATYPVSVVLGTIDAGVTITRSYDPKTTIASAWSQLATDCNGYWDIDPRPPSPTVNFIVTSIPAAPFTLHDANVRFGTNKYRASRSDFRSVQIVETPPGVTAPKVVSFPGDGSTTDFTLPTLPNQVMAASLTTGDTPATVDGTYSSNPAVGDTFTVGGLVYTYVVSLDNAAARQVFIGATSAATGANAADAVNAKPATRGVKFSSPTAINPNVSAVFAVGTLTLSANQQGAAGNGIVVSKTGTAFAWSAASTSGGITGEVSPITVDIAGLRGAGLYWSPGSTTISAPTAPASGTNLVVTYTDSMANFVTLQNDSATALGIGSQQQIMTARNLSQYEQSIQQGGAVLEGRSVIPAEYRFISDDAGYHTGDGLTVALLEPPQLVAKVNGQPWIIQDVSAEWIEGMELNDEPYGHFRHSVHCVNTKVFTPYQETLQRLVDNPLRNLPGGTQQPITDAGGGTVLDVIAYQIALELSDVTVGDDIAPHVTIAMPEIAKSPLNYRVGIGMRTIGVLRKPITDDLVVRFNKITNGSPPTTFSWTVTIPNGTPINYNIYDYGNADAPFYEGDIMGADAVASDGQPVDANGIASFTVVWA